jgi:hypothetical protein
MKKVFCLALTLCLAGCGYTSRDGEMIGQAKKISMRTPLICPNYYALDISLGIVRDGTGSMSTQDVWLTVYDLNDLDKMKAAVAAGAIVRVHYDMRRMAICTEDYVSTGFEVVP